MAVFRLLLPETLLLVGGLVALVAELLPGRGRGAAWLAAGLSAAAAVIAFAVGTGPAIFSGALLVDRTAVFARGSVAALTAVWSLWVAGRGLGDERRQEGVALGLLAGVGGMLMASAADLVTLFIAIELATMPAYVLIGYRRRDVRGLEGTLKYFLLSLTTSLVMLYGFAFLYGVSGTTAYEGLDISRAGLLGLVGAVFGLVGLLAKMSAAPFHFWAPDAYAGAPAASVAFVSSVPKVAGITAIVRLAGVLEPQAGVLLTVFALVAAASMLLGNLAAFPQNDLRRLMAYSGVAHTGYLLMGPAVGTRGALGASVLYGLAYAAPSMAVMFLAAEEGCDLGDVSGLVRRRPWIAWANLVFLLSLIGIPPLVGFTGKLVLFGQTLGAGTDVGLALVVLAVVMSVVSAGYYFRVVRAMFLGEDPKEPAVVGPSTAASLAYGGLLAGVVLLGIFWSPTLSALAIP